MPRIRSIKPEFWTSAQVLECSPNARLMFIGIWNFCDDSGRHAFRPKQIKAEVFPIDEFTTDDILGMLQELSGNGLIELYEVDGQQYLRVTGWHHQRIDRPQPSKHPEPIGDDSANDPGMFSPDRKGKDKKGEDIGQSQGIDRFSDFWNVYPKKVKKQDARKRWKSRKLDSKADDIIADVKDRAAKDGRWLDGYVPDPTTYIDGNRWEDALEPLRPDGSKKPDWARVPHADDDLPSWASKHGYPQPSRGTTHSQYRQTLRQAVEQRRDQLRSQNVHVMPSTRADRPSAGK